MAFALRDPEGLLDRVPELESLAQDVPSIRKAIEGGDSHAVYHALRWAHWWARWSGLAVERRSLARTLLGTRRLFLKPLRGAPTMVTINGVGAKAYGSDEPGDDGTFVLTHYVVVLFLPIVPLGSYLVRQVDAGGWTFFGRVPLDAFHWVWQRLCALTLLSVVLVGAWGTVHRARFAEVRVLNGLPVPVVVQVGKGSPSTVPAQGEVIVDAPVGNQHVEVTTTAHKPVSRVEVEVKAGVDVQVVNVLGAAFVLTAQNPYGPKDLTEKYHLEPEIFCGQSWISIDDVDDPFREPPKSMKVRDGEVVKRRWVGTLPGGAVSCMRQMAFVGHVREAAELARVVAELTNYPADAVEEAVELASRAGLDPSQLAEAGRRAHDDSIAHHRIYQDVATHQGRRQALLDEYGHLRDAQPDSPDAAYLYARLVRGPEALPLAEALAQRFSKHVWLARLRLYVHMFRREYRAGLLASDSLYELDPSAWLETAPLLAPVMYTQGRLPEFVTKLQAQVSKLTDTDAALQFQVALMTLSKVTQDPRVDSMLAKLAGPIGDEKEPQASRRALLAKWRVSPEALSEQELQDLSSHQQLRTRAIRSPATVIEALHQVFATLDRDLWLLLFGEAHRVAEPSAQLAADLRRLSPFDAREIAEFERYLREGVAGEEIAELGVTEQASLAFARSRRADVTPEERARLLARVDEDVPLPCLLSSARAQWPAAVVSSSPRELRHRP